MAERSPKYHIFRQFAIVFGYGLCKLVVGICRYVAWPCLKLSLILTVGIIATMTHPYED